MEEMKKLISSDKYNFIHTNKHLGNNIILLTLNSSYSYGINTKNSDIDIRGCALNSKKEILLSKDFESYTNNETDTVIYSFNKFIKLLTNGSPNTIEILGLNPEHYLYIHPIGREILDNKNLFLSKELLKKYEGFITAQMKKIVRKTSLNQDCNKIIANVLRLYFTAIELFETNEIKTYRTNERELVLKIKEGKIDDNEISEILEDAKERLKLAYSKTTLPDKPDYEAIEEFVISVNERVVKNNIDY